MAIVEHISENVDLIKLGERSIYLIGTAHVSQASADQATDCIRNVRPNSVAVELCSSRYSALKDPNRWRNTDIVKIVREGRAYLLLAQLMLVGFQKKLGKHLQIQPGAEMMAALGAAEEVGAAPIFADRDVRLTLKRTWGALSWTAMLKLLYGMLMGMFTTQEIDSAEIERLKSADALEELLRDFSQALPSVRITLIDERDQYLAAKIRQAPGNTVVAVVGAGHVPGIRKWIDQKIDLETLETLPRPSFWRRLFTWLIPVFVLALFAVGCFQSGAGKSMQMAETWFIVTGAAAALGSALALAHPFTILSAFIVTPFTTLPPFRASGLIAGLVEAVLRKPKVEDLEKMADDVVSVRGWYHNRVIRILLVVCFTNILGTIGTVIGIQQLASWLQQ